eukprot:CAMPEP_0174351802 /NCGR_PEP_ID=MMETSP0811_2-20130205/9283_1 /TAXON_ID=73025 ORGANISM="Eutreptiella gymnastica-like, Strain CCMP1594" /NCGR_SAMPLE_ID=MMETSP0811_2 /ASSEMBLY_ACC=CAM_ASM_000667 /LENGTH=66 /DNA_ID=CAMNT_0015481399 /DNA_START=837 /DNA_END=1037 /DNA_ORIENTATION=-
MSESGRGDLWAPFVVHVPARCARRYSLKAQDIGSRESDAQYAAFSGVNKGGFAHKSPTVIWATPDM